MTDNTATTFFCQVCLEDKPPAATSPDPRYCQGCYDYLLVEASMLPATKRPAWIPKHRAATEGVKRQYQVEDTDPQLYEVKKPVPQLIPRCRRVTKAGRERQPELL